MIKFSDKKWLNIGSLLEVFTFAIFLFIYYGLLWVKNTFDNVSIDLIIFNILSPLDLARCGFEIRNNFIKQVLGPTIVTLIFFIAVIYLFKKYNFYLSIKKFSIKLKLWIVYILFAFLILFILLKYFSLIEYVRQQMDRTEIYSKYYINPDKINFEFPDKKRNLIIIFLESMESSYLSKKEGGLFDENLIPELTELARENINFSNSDNIGGSLQINGVGWTMGALVGYLSGIPLSIPIQGNEYGNHLKFLPGVTTLMDILNKYGYRQVYMIGSDKNFAGRDKFFEQHGNVVVKDIQYFKDAGKLAKDYWVWWGFEDEKLYSFAKDELKDLSNSNIPFAFYMLTVDTHHMDGYVCRLCPNKHKEQYKNVLNCSSKQVYDFVEWIKKQSFYKNTTVIILGDHLFMNGSFFPQDTQITQRHPLNIFINSAKKPLSPKNRLFSTLDIFPSIFDSLGVEYNSDGLGLGRSLFKDTKTLIEVMGYDKLNEEVSKKSSEYKKFIKGK